MSVGFGKFSYSPSIFHKVEVVMPKLEFGIISKVINLGHADVFIKTDAALYNGFSGSGVWLGENLIGMAVFILKNKKSESNYNRHNFSYTYEFIEKLLSQKNSEELIS